MICRTQQLSRRFRAPDARNTSSTAPSRPLRPVVLETNRRGSGPKDLVAAWNAGVIGSIVLAAVSAVVVAWWFLGNEPLFRVPAFELAHATELFIYAGIGAISGVLSAGFVKLIEVIRDPCRPPAAVDAVRTAGDRGIADRDHRALATGDYGRGV